MKSMIIILAMLFSFAACTLPDLSASIIIGTTGASKFTGCVPDAFGKCVEQCEKPKVFLECGSACPPTCAKPKPTVCTLQCVKGCFCPKGTFLNGSGKCVEKCSSNGNPWCPNSKVYTECGSLCPPTCADPNPGPCAAVCVKGCFCPKGTLENATGECVKQCSSNGSNSSGSGSTSSSSASSASSSASSSSSSGSNPWCPNSKVYTDCGSACPPTCAKPNPEACGSACVKGCFCPKGTLENAAGECVEQCSTNGSNSSGNGSTSSSSASSASSSASSSSGSGPVSNDGFIPKVNNDCGSACPPTCANPNPVCTKQCVKGAFCPDGTFENASGNCVKTC